MTVLLTIWEVWVTWKSHHLGTLPSLLHYLVVSAIQIPGFSSWDFEWLLFTWIFRYFGMWVHFFTLCLFASILKGGSLYIPWGNGLQGYMLDYIYADCIRLDMRRCSNDRKVQSAVHGKTTCLWASEEAFCVQLSQFWNFLTLLLQRPNAYQNDIRNASFFVCEYTYKMCRLIQLVTGNAR